MNCPKCGYKTNQSVCPECKTDIQLSGKIKSVSNLLYNKGLSFAQSGDMSRAIECLNKCIEISKDNVSARNLLGLCYFNVGKVGDALKQWIVSAALNKSNLQASQYIDKVQNDSTGLDRLNDAVKMYNQSINYLKSRSEDMAIIQLKKAIELSPNFVDAYNLLALCQMIEGDNSKALIAVEKSLSIDSGNPVASNYFNLLGGKARSDLKRQPPKEPKQETYKRYAPVVTKPGFGGKNLQIAGILCFIVGALISLGVVYYIMVPDVISQNNQKIAELNETLEEERLKNRTAINNKDIEIQNAIDEKNSVMEKNQELLAQIDLQDRIQKVSSAISMQQSGRNEEAANLLMSLNTEGFPIDVMETHNNTLKLALPPLVLENYNKGTSSYNRRLYDEAQDFFLLVIKYHYTESQYTDDALYFLGRIAEVNGDNDKAKEYYGRLVEEFPGSNQIYNANSRLKAL